MDKSDTAQSAYQFLLEFKNEILNQVHELNARNDGELQDGFNPVFLEDGWISLKGFAWGFVMHYDDPVRMDMVVGPDWPFIGYRHTFKARVNGGGIAWINQDRPDEIYTNARQLARYGLRRLASKVGDEWVFDAHRLETETIAHDPYYGNELTAG
jgi:hypothetical protein